MKYLLLLVLIFSGCYYPKVVVKKELCRCVDLTTYYFYINKNGKTKILVLPTNEYLIGDTIPKHKH